MASAGPDASLRRQRYGASDETAERVLKDSQDRFFFVLNMTFEGERLFSACLSIDDLLSM